jgi:hypothetical protein
MSDQTLLVRRLFGQALLMSYPQIVIGRGEGRQQRRRCQSDGSNVFITPRIDPDRVLFAQTEIAARRREQRWLHQQDKPGVQDDVVH